MDSTNGTYLNGAELRGEAALSDMDEIQIGDTVLRFELVLEGDVA
jgi:pSer/pThr/pTyr-binding forkhead associated (FHA) protein